MVVNLPATWGMTPLPTCHTLLFLNPDFFPVPYHVPPVSVGTNSEDSASEDDVGRQQPGKWSREEEMHRSEG